MTGNGGHLRIPRQHGGMPALLLALAMSCPVVQAEGTFENLKFSVGGRIKLDGIYNDRSVGRNKLNRSDLTFVPGSIPLTGNDSEDLDFNFRDTRLWATAYLPVFEHELSGYAEIDFSPIDRTDAGQPRLTSKPRLRHAYATFAGFTAGKTYTAFLNVSAYPETNDVNGPLGILNVRQELLRYSRTFDWGNAMLSVEEPDSTLTTTDGSSVPVDDADFIPDIIAKLEFINDYGNWSVAALTRGIRSDGVVPGGKDDTQWGAAVSVAGRLYINASDNLRFSASYGNVLGRYLSFNAFDDGVVADNGRINLTEMFGGYLAYQHWWTDQLRSSLVAGYARADHDLSVAPDSVDKQFYSTHLNLIWSPVLNTSLGIEWLHTFRELEDGRDGNIDRLQLTAIYKF